MIKYLSLSLLLWASFAWGESTRLRIYSSQQPAVVEPLVASFEKQNAGIDVTVEYFSTEDLQKKLDAEYRVSTTLADVVMADDVSIIENLIAEQRCVRLDDIETKMVYPALLNADRYALPTKVINLGIAYNTSMAYRPTSWKDLWIDHIKAPYTWLEPATTGGGAALYMAMLQSEALGEGFLERAINRSLIVSSNLNASLHHVIKGKIKMGVATDIATVRAKLEGESVRFVIPQEGMVVLTEPMAIPKSSRHMVEGKKWVAFVLSEAGQRIISRAGYAPCRRDISTPLGFVSGQRFKFLPTAYNKEKLNEVMTKLSPLLKQKPRKIPKEKEGLTIANFVLSGETPKK